MMQVRRNSSFDKSSEAERRGSAKDPAVATEPEGAGEGGNTESLDTATRTSFILAAKPPVSPSTPSTNLATPKGGLKVLIESTPDKAKPSIVKVCPNSADSISTKHLGKPTFHTGSRSADNSRSNIFKKKKSVLVTTLCGLYNPSEKDSGFLSQKFLELMEEAGIQTDDPRIKTTIGKLQELGGLKRDIRLNEDQFHDVMHSDSVFINSVFQGQLVVPDFVAFTKILKSIYQSVKKRSGGHVASYIPELAKQDPDMFGISVCTIDGQRWSIGDSEVPVCVQSCCKPIAYLMAAEENGFEKVHHHIGREPSGTKFNMLTLKEVAPCADGSSRKIPHNPMINAGAIMSHSLIKPKSSMAERFGFAMDTWRKLCGNTRIAFDNPTYLSERDSADRNWCLGYMMQEFHSFPEGTVLRDTLEFYFQSCSIQINLSQAAVVASTLANGGVNPLTGEQVFSSHHVRNCLSLMLSSGMYDFSGEWAFTVGLPAKSGVAGLIYIVVPNKMGIAIWSPPLDENGNSWRGVEVAKELVARFNFHHFDTLKGVLCHQQSNKIDPTANRQQLGQHETMAVLFAASTGDLGEMQRLKLSGVDVWKPDYDARSALHLAASEGNYEIVEYLLSLSKDMSLKEQHDKINARDRWNRTPYDDALSGLAIANCDRYKKCVELLKAEGCVQSDDLPDSFRLVMRAPKKQIGSDAFFKELKARSRKGSVSQGAVTSITPSKSLCKLAVLPKLVEKDE